MVRPLEPRVLAQRRAQTLFLRCPAALWTMVSSGKVSEFRCATGNAPQVWQTRLPTIAVVYRKRTSSLNYDYRSMILEAVRREALGAITNEGLAAAGYDSFARFRRDWCLQEHRQFEPLRTVFVFTVHPLEPGDLERAGATLVEALYGEYVAHDGVRTVPAERGAGATTRRPRHPQRSLAAR